MKIGLATKDFSPQIYADERRSGKTKASPLINTDDTEQNKQNFNHRGHEGT
jgi:hypothetical protein